MKSIKDQSLSKIELKNVLLRLDLNVPLDNGKIIDDTRLHNIVDTIIFLLRNNAKIVIISHYLPHLLNNLLRGEGADKDRHLRHR